MKIPTVSLLLLLLALAAAPAQAVWQQGQNADGCPSPFDRLDATRCILVDPFIKRPFEDAQEYCSAHGGRMVHIDNCLDQTLVYDYLHTMTGLENNHYWLGATDQSEEGVWRWAHDNGLVPMGSPFWHINEPNGGAGSDCAVLHSLYYHRFVDVSCTAEHDTICLRDG